MFKLSHFGLVTLSGCIWTSIGMFLMPLGLFFLGETLSATPSEVAMNYPLVSMMSGFFGGTETAAVVIIALGLFIGSAKAKYVLSKTVNKGIARILALPNPAYVTNVYGFKYLLLVAFMISLGASLRYFGVPKDVRGMVDVAVGSALITGGTSYFRAALSQWQVQKS